MKFATIVLLSFLPTTAMAQAACGAAGFKASGSDTVYPVALSWVPGYQKLCPKATPITVTAGGSSVGAKEVCAGTVDVGMMSRDFKTTEATPIGTTGSYTCVTGGKKVIQVAIAADGLIIIAKKNGNAAKCIAAMGGLTVPQLNQIFTNMTASVKMKALNAKCADVEVKITGPDSNSGTQSFFADTVFNKTETFRASYFDTDSADFDEVVKTVLSDGDYIGFCPISYFNKNKNTLVAAKIKNKLGVYVVPSAASISNGNYNPFARRVFMNVLSDSMANVKDYIKYGFSAAGLKLVTAGGLVPLPAGIIAQMVKRLV